MSGINPPARAVGQGKRIRRERQFHGTSCICGMLYVCAWVVCLMGELSVVMLMRWLDRSPTPLSMQSGKGMWSTNDPRLRQGDP